MKQIALASIILLVAVLACQFLPTPESTQPTATPPQSQHRCGDGVCDGPENESKCPQDCVSAPVLDEEPGEEGVSEQNNSSGESAPNAAENPGSTGSVLAEIYVEAHVSRKDGEGTCPTPPWGVDHIQGGDFSCQPPKYWFGYDLKATAHQLLQITPQGQQSWLISGAQAGGGTYQQEAHWSDGNRVCSPVSIEGSTFAFNVEGGYTNSQIELTMAADPGEKSQWQCDQGNSYERETTLLLIDWAVAMSGDYTDLSARLPSTLNGWVRQSFILDTNPSPEPRDHVEVVVDFTCVEKVESDTYKQRRCPWEE